MAYTGPNLTPLLNYGLNQENPITSLGQNENELLDLVRQLDPNASWKYQDNSGSSNEGGGSAANNWVLDFDNTKLPTALPGSPQHQQGTNMLGLINSSGLVQGMTSLNDPDSYASNNLLYPQFQWDTPYGQMTPSFNVREDTSFMDTVFKVAPWLIGGLGGLMAGLPAMMAGGGLSSLFGGGNAMFSILNSLMQQGAATHGFENGMNINPMMALQLIRALGGGMGGG